MSTVIVALPDVDDIVNKVSSETKAHMTILYLGEASLSQEAMLYIQHTCSELSPFGFSVDYRGELGEAKADVLFFENRWWDMERVGAFRHYLLLNDEIKRAYDSVEQFPEWTPHLTLGYPEKPAHPLPDDRKINWVEFDRIAVWAGEADSEGPEFRLRYDETSVAVAMSDISTAQRGSNAASRLFHYGKKGMQWGVITEEDGSSSPSGTRPVELTAAENKADPNGPSRRDLVKKAALIAGGVAVVGGVAYGAHRYSQSKGADSRRQSPEPEKKELQQPTSLIYLARAKNKGLTFHQKGDTPDFFDVFDKMGMNDNNRIDNGDMVKDSVTGNIAARMLDPLGRTDHAGRPISHDFVIPKNMASGIDTIDDVREKIWPKVSDQYQKFWDENLTDRRVDAQHSEEGGVSMSDISTAQRGASAVAEMFHYGKKGMKWGVRNDKGHEGEAVKTKKLDKLDKSWEKNEARNAFWQAHNAAADKMNNGEIDRINNKPEHKAAADAGKFDDWENPTPELNAYMKEMDDTFNAHFADAVVARGSNPSGTKRYELRTDEDGNTWAELTTVKHAEGDVEVRYKITKNDKGMVTKYTPEEVVLQHYGVKGMRWGVRRDEATSRGGASSGPTAVVVTQKKPGKFAKTSGGQGAPLHEDAIRALEGRQIAKKSTTDALSNAELKRVVDRMRLEQQYTQLAYASDRRSKGQKFVAGLLGYRKDLKFKDLDEEAGQMTRDQIAKIFEERERMREAAA